MLLLFQVKRSWLEDHQVLLLGFIFHLQVFYTFSQIHFLSVLAIFSQSIACQFPLFASFTLASEESFLYLIHR
jgi:hypothetical protein